MRMTIWRFFLLSNSLKSPYYQRLEGTHCLLGIMQKFINLAFWRLSGKIDSEREDARHGGAARLNRKGPHASSTDLRSRGETHPSRYGNLSGQEHARVHAREQRLQYELRLAAEGQWAERQSDTGAGRRDQRRRSPRRSHGDLASNEEGCQSKRPATRRSSSRHDAQRSLQIVHCGGTTGTKDSEGV